ncbi:MAG: hypothetical protein EU540_03985 [Promethearchaeota archaeon]|nr:MAG: hypothetical protein EU540_03985 [Candidatus Lokiarchaeota archaeon]
MVEAKVNLEKRDDFESKIRIEAYNLMNACYPYDVLCWELAEFILLYQKGHGKYSEHDLSKKKEMIFDISPTYEQICLLISTYKCYLTQEHRYP